METATPQSQAHEPHTRRILLLGIAVWFLDQSIVYGLASVSCKWSYLSTPVGPISALQLVETLVTLTAMLVMAYLVYLPWRTWRSYQSAKPTHNPHLLQDTEKDPRSLEAFIVMMLNSFFLLFIIGFYVPVFALNACAQA